MGSKKSLLSFRSVIGDDKSAKDPETAREQALLRRCLQIAASELAILQSHGGFGFRCMRCRLMISPDYRREIGKCPYCRHQHSEPAQIHESMLGTAIQRWHDNPETKRSVQWHVDETDLLPWIEVFQRRFTK